MQKFEEKTDMKTVSYDAVSKPFRNSWTKYTIQMI